MFIVKAFNFHAWRTFNKLNQLMEYIPDLFLPRWNNSPSQNLTFLQGITSFFINSKIEYNLRDFGW